jgi:hypothetical protein
MTRLLGVPLAGLALVLVAAGAEGPAPPAGTWKLLLASEDGRMQPVALVRLDGTRGKWSAKVLARSAGLPGLQLKDLAVTGGTLRGMVQLGEGSFRLECPVPKGGGVRMRGSLSRQNTSPVEFEPTTLSSLDEFELAREAVARAEGYEAVRAALTLLSQATEKKAKPEEVRSWAAKAVKSAEAYGPAWHRTIVLGVAEILSEQKGHAGVGLTYARQAERLLDAADRPALRKRVLDVLAGSLAAAGKADEAREVEGRAAKIDFTIHPRAYPGRKGNSERVVLVELFTGTQCPPCVAADLAFDALGKSFKPTEVVRLQYHLHVPGPDPLTGPDSEARAKFYGRAVSGTPALLVNGRAAAPGGGGREDGGDKFEEYLAAISPLLETPARAEVRVRARRSGLRVAIRLEADAPEGAGDNLRLRCVLVEDKVGYAGPNKVAEHHHVVRAFPGGVDGEKLAPGTPLRKSLSVDLDELRKGLRTYLDGVAQENPFPGKERPLDLKDLRVVAFVQNDATGEVLQAVQADVAE